MTSPPAGCCHGRSVSHARQEFGEQGRADLHFQYMCPEVLTTQYMGSLVPKTIPLWFVGPESLDIGTWAIWGVYVHAQDSQKARR